MLNEQRNAAFGRENSEKKILEKIRLRGAIPFVLGKHKRVAGGNTQQVGRSGKGKVHQ